MQKNSHLACAAAYCSIAWVLLVFGSATAGLGQTAASSHCLSYEPSVVTLTGTLVRKTFPGPPNYEDVRHGDRPETYWFLKLSNPICVDEDKAQPDLNPAHKDIRTIQLVVSSELYKKYKYMMGLRVVATGRLFGEQTIHHRTPVLLTVETLAQADKPGR
jgi:Domain of unknown function (DUF4431)